MISRRIWGRRFMVRHQRVFQESGQGAIKLDFFAHIMKQHVSQHPQFFSHWHRDRDVETRETPGQVSG